MANLRDNQSIQDTMKRLSLRMDSILDDHERRHGRDDDIPDELRFWLAVDPLLSHLYKQMIDAKGHHKNLKSLRGAEDPMTDVAADIYDSSICAFKTRLLELRHNEEAKAAVLAMAKKAHDEHEDALTAEVQARSERFWKEFSRRKAHPVRALDGSASMWMVLAGLVALRQIVDQAQTHLSIAASFGRAANESSLKRRFAAS